MKISRCWEEGWFYSYVYWKSNTNSDLQARKVFKKPNERGKLSLAHIINFMVRENITATSAI
jgi:hypothetical protein